MATAAPKFIKPQEMDEIASGHLKRLGLYAIPINPGTVAEKEGIGVFSIRFADESVSGVIRKIDGRYQILVNKTHSIRRIKYTIAHELGHYFLHKEYAEFVDPELNLYRCCQSGESESTERVMEIQANMFAASLLMPAELLLPRFEAIRDVGALAKEFRVSRDAMGIRIASLGLE